jgi:Cu-processing system permease protein
MNALVIARLTWREASRRWVLWAALLLGLLFLAVYALGVSEIYNAMSRDSVNPIFTSEMLNFLLLAGLYVVNFLASIMAVLTSVDTLSGEISSGVVHTVLSKPVNRWEVVVGKWIGFATMLTPYLLLMGGGVILINRLFTGYQPENSLNGLALIWLNVLLLLSLTLFGGTFLSTLANGVLVFGLYGVAFMGSWIEQFGSFLQNQTAVNIGILCSLLLPSEALWRRAAFEMQSPLVSMMGGFTPFSAQSVPSAAMLVYGVLYGAAALALAVRSFQGRDL